MISTTVLEQLHKSLSGDVLFDSLHKTLYATDASVYRMTPTAVAYPKSVDDLKILKLAAKKTNGTIEGVISGRAIYDGRLNIRDGIAILNGGF